MSDCSWKLDQQPPGTPGLIFTLSARLHWCLLAASSTCTMACATLLRALSAHPIITFSHVHVDPALAPKTGKAPWKEETADWCTSAPPAPLDPWKKRWLCEHGCPVKVLCPVSKWSDNVSGDTKNSMCTITLKAATPRIGGKDIGQMWRNLLGTGGEKQVSQGKKGGEHT